MIWQFETIVSPINELGENSSKVMDSGKQRRKKRFKTSNKILVSLVFITSLTVGVGVNTYSWFTSSAISAASQITVGKFKLDLDLADSQNTSALIFDGTKLQPGVKTEEKTISFINSGDIDMVLKGTLSIDGKDELNTFGVGDLNAYRVIATVYKNARKDENVIYTDGSGVNKDLFNEQLNNILNPKSEMEKPPIIFKPGDRLICIFQFVLDGPSATKAHQGDNVSGSFTVNARQNVNEATYSEK